MPRAENGPCGDLRRELSEREEEQKEMRGKKQPRARSEGLSDHERAGIILITMRSYGLALSREITFGLLVKRAL